MRSLAWKAVSAVSFGHVRAPCHFLATRRQRITPRRSLYDASSRNDSSPSAPERPHDTSASQQAKLPGSAPDAPPEEPRPEDTGTPGKPAKSVDTSSYGSASRRAGRNIKKPTDLPPCRLPQEFIEENVWLLEDYDNALGEETDREPPNSYLVVQGEKLAASYRRSHGSVWSEILSMFAAGLVPPATSNASFSAKPHLILHCPQEGSNQFLHFLVMELARLSRAELISIDAHDIAKIGGGYLDEPGMSPDECISSLSYEIFAHPAEEPTEGENIEVMEYEEKPRRPASSVKVRKGPSDSHKQQHPPEQAIAYVTLKDSTRELKIAKFVDTLLHACDTKRAMATSDDEPADKTNSVDDSPKAQDPHTGSCGAEAKDPSHVSPPIIVLVHDYPEIYDSENGGSIMDALHDALYERRKEGRRFLLVGTCSVKLRPGVRLREGKLEEPWEFEAGPTRTVLVPSGKELEVTFSVLHDMRVSAINTAHLRAMLGRLTGNPERISSVISTPFGFLSSSWTTRACMSSQVWSADQIYRLATVAIGLMAREGKDLSETHVEEAVTLFMENTKLKSDWVREMINEETRERDGVKHQFQGLNKKGMDSEAVQAKLRKECNKYEKRLLHGVVDPSSIRTTFGDIRAPKETIETLKTLTSLSLLRPDAFTYGVLATDKITGVLLYGPPGTGKTLLARAVAKESGATVLEVSGADLYNMWVGEGEKNVKAVFSLAKKLTPCIVFIDEADAILGSRGGPSTRPSHRELINQFLREWDGMGEQSAFIMVATNRPFDLDEATLRRLPRRILVDLPTEKDREEILKIHLKDEILDSQISLSKLAFDTPLYSGSDLKNVCVAAALSCVREEYDAANNSSKATTVKNDSSSPSPSSPQPPPAGRQSILDLLTKEMLAAAEPSPSRSSSPSSPQQLSNGSLPSPSSSISKAWAAVSAFSGTLSDSIASASDSNPTSSKPPSPPGSSPSTDPATSTDPKPPPPPVPSQLPHLSPTSPSPSAPTPKKNKPPPPPPKRILRPHHFARALEEISASVSEDMRSLTQIKKFDEKYGDRRGRKKKLGGGYGFGTLDKKERESVEAKGGRVRVGTAG